MNKIILLASATILGAQAASAQGLADWSGFYAGGQYATNDGDFTNLNAGLPIAGGNLGGDTFGAFVSYNRQTGNLVYGGELAYSAGTITVDGSSDQGFDSLFDVKARLGYAFDRALVYGTVAYTRDNWKAFSTNTNAEGHGYRIGVEYMATDSLVLGVEYMRRSLATDAITFPPPQTVESDFDTFALRIAYRF